MITRVEIVALSAIAACNLEYQLCTESAPTCDYNWEKCLEYSRCRLEDKRKAIEAEFDEELDKVVAEFYACVAGCCIEE